MDQVVAEEAKRKAVSSSVMVRDCRSEPAMTLRSVSAMTVSYLKPMPSSKARKRRVSWASGLRSFTSSSRCLSVMVLFWPQGWVQVSEKRETCVETSSNPSARFTSDATSPRTDSSINGFPSTLTAYCGTPASVKENRNDILPSGEYTSVPAEHAARTDIAAIISSFFTRSRLRLCRRPR